MGQPYAPPHNNMTGIAYQTQQENSHLLRESLQSHTNQSAMNQNFGGAMHSSYHNNPNTPIQTHGGMSGNPSNSVIH